MKRRRGNRGVSLVEVLVATSLFAAMGSAVATLGIASMKHTVRNRHATAAAIVASERLEDLRNLDYASIASGIKTVTVGGQAYTITTTVFPENPAPNMKKIKITVSWVGPEGQRTYVLETIYTSLSG